MEFLVSGGQGSAPFYTFVPHNPAKYSFRPGGTYTFIADGISTRFPFAIGRAHGEDVSFASGQRLKQSRGFVTFTIPEDYVGPLVFYCPYRRNMVQALKIVAPHLEMTEAPTMIPKTLTPISAPTMALTPKRRKKPRPYP